MPLVETDRRQPIPYFPFPKNPDIVHIGKFEALGYVLPEQIASCIKSLSEKVSLRSFDHIIVNQNGGSFLYKEISRLQQYNGPYVSVEVHRPTNGFGANVSVELPKNIIGTRSLVIDDIYDSGGTLKYIMSHLSADSEAAILVTKRGIDNQIPINNIHIGLCIDNVWVAGCGMDIGEPKEKNTFRKYAGIVVKRPS